MEAQEKSRRSKLQEVGLDPNQTAEELKRYLSIVEDQIRSIADEQAVTKSEMGTSQNRISSLTTENKCPLCLQDLTGDYKEGLLERLRDENVERERKLVELQKNLDELEGLQSIVDLAVSNLQSLIPQIEGTKKQVSEEQESLEKLSAEFENAQQQEKKLRSQLSATRAEITKFDVAELESAQELRDNAFNKYSNTKNKLEPLERRKDDIALRIDDLKERLDHAQQKIERIGKIEKLLEIIDSIRGSL